MDKNGYLLSWTPNLYNLKEQSGAFDLFATGFASSALFFFALVIIFRLLPKKRHNFLERAWTVLAFAVFFSALGLCFFLFSGPAFMAAGVKLQILGLGGFQTAAFCMVCMDLCGKLKREKLFLILAAGAFCVLLPLWGAAVTLSFGAYSAFLVVLCGLCAGRALKAGQRWGGFMRLGLVISVSAGALFIPLYIPQLFLRAGVLLVFIVAENYLAAGPVFFLKDEDAILPEKEANVSLKAINPFIPKEFLSILKKNTIMDLQLGDHIKQEMTIFFSDIRQFSELSEHLTPEEGFKFINSYLSRIVPVIIENNGFVDKYVGDAIMALFPQEKGADMAVRTAIAIQKKLLEYNKHRASRGYRPLSMGIGLHTGTLMLGVVGVEDRMQNTVISDAVNLASRLENITKFFKISMAISEETFKKLEDPGSYMYRFIGKVRVKGKAAPVSVFEIFDGIDPEIMELKMRANMFFEQGMLNYYQKNYTDAMLNFQKVVEIVPNDGASVFYLHNCLSKIN
ncbi:MAG: adenylate/guanylate cyclase domain-containing protein [Treponema sp.]|jgi:two-component system sensor histidine kinase ChiS|nr:adenylate/guanylate cyclase domain-containing protein [Treponema sp.]